MYGKPLATFSVGGWNESRIRAAQTGLELLILLPSPPQGWGYSHMLSFLRALRCLLFTYFYCTCQTFLLHVLKLNNI